MFAWLLLIVPVAVAILYPIAQNYLRAASLLERVSDPHASGWIANYDVHPVDVQDTTFDFRGHAIPARVYLPRGVGFAPGIVVVHGMHELGIDEPRLMNFARSLAAGGFVVMTPLVPGIADYRVEAESADVIGSAARDFARHLKCRRWGSSRSAFREPRTGSRERPTIRPGHRLGSFDWRLLRSGTCTAFFRNRRGHAS